MKSYLLYVYSFSIIQSVAINITIISILFGFHPLNEALAIRPIQQTLPQTITMHLLYFCVQLPSSNWWLHTAEPSPHQGRYPRPDTQLLFKPVSVSASRSCVATNRALLWKRNTSKVTWQRISRMIFLMVYWSSKLESNGFRVVDILRGWSNSKSFMLKIKYDWQWKCLDHLNKCSIFCQLKSNVHIKY